METAIYTTIVVVVCALVFVLITLLLRKKQKAKIKIGKNSLEFSENENFFETNNRLLRLKRLMEEKITLQNDYLGQQMFYFERKCKVTLNDMIHLLTSELNIVPGTPESKKIVLLVLPVQHIIREEIRKIFKKNHLYDYNFLNVALTIYEREKLKSNWLQYTHEIADCVHSEVQLYVTEYFGDNFLSISSDKFSEKFDAKIKDMNYKALSRVLDRARLLSIELYKKLDSIDNEINVIIGGAQ